MRASCVRPIRVRHGLVYTSISQKRGQVDRLDRRALFKLYRAVEAVDSSGSEEAFSVASWMILE